MNSWGDDPYLDDDDSVIGVLDFLASSPAKDAGAPTLMFTTTSPDGYISVTATFAGRVDRVDLSPGVATRTEADLAAEILRIANLAQRRALAGMHAIIAENLARRGHDRFGVGAWIERTLGLPSPTTVQQEAAEVFAHYADRGE